MKTGADLRYGSRDPRSQVRAESGSIDQGGEPLRKLDLQG